MYSGEIRGGLMRRVERHFHVDDESERAQQLDVMRYAINATEQTLLRGFAEEGQVDSVSLLVDNLSDLVPYDVPQTLLTGIYDDGDVRAAMTNKLGMWSFTHYLHAVELAHGKEADKLASAVESGLLSHDEEKSKLNILHNSQHALNQAIRFNQAEDIHNAWTERMRKPAREVGIRQRLKDILNPAQDPLDAYKY